MEGWLDRHGRREEAANAGDNQSVMKQKHKRGDVLWMMTRHHGPRIVIVLDFEDVARGTQVLYGTQKMNVSGFFLYTPHELETYLSSGIDPA